MSIVPEFTGRIIGGYTSFVNIIVIIVAIFNAVLLINVIAISIIVVTAIVNQILFHIFYQ